MQKSSTKIKKRNLIAKEFIEKQRFNLRKLRIFFDSDVPELTANMKTRLFLVWGLLTVSGLGLAINLYNLQIVRGPELRKRARNQQMVAIRPFIPRRPVLDRNSQMVAIDRPTYTFYVHPKLFTKSRKDIAQKLAPIINQDAGELENKFEKKRSGILIAANLPEEIADQVKALRLNGLDLTKKYARFYPQQNLFSEVVGYVNLDRRGQAGVEYSQEKLLERSSKTLRISRKGNGLLMSDRAPQGFLNADDLRVQLTVDSRLQRSARTALAAQMKKFRAKRGAVIVMDAWDGSILAMASQPTYNPNEYSKADISLFRNWTVADLYEPGSTFKPINVALALEAGVIQRNTVFHDSGLVKVDGWPIRNATLRGNGSINIAEILQTSSNVAMVHMMRRLKKDDYYRRLQALEIDQKTGIELPGEVRGRLKSEKVFMERSIEVATSSFGQGFALTPMKLVQLQGALANGGKLVTPHLVKGLVDVEGTLHWQPKYPTKQIFSPEVSQTVVELMQTVVDKGSAAKTENYRIGGKTGTAQKAGPRGGYLPNAKITSFVSIFPVESPKYVVLVLVDEPQGANTYGSTVAAPVAKFVIDALISLKGIPPSK